MSKAYKNIPVPLPFNLLRGLTGVNPLIVNYHVVSDSKLPHIENLYNYRNIKAFVEDLDFYCKKYHLIGMNEFLESIRNNTNLPKNSLLLTFDDGFKEVFEIVAPILVDKKLTATVFLTSNFIDNKELNYDNIKSLIIDRIKHIGNNQTNNKILKMLESQGLTGKDLSGMILGIPYTKRPLIDELARELNLDIAGFLLGLTPYMTSPQIRELINSGFTFGSHSIDHACYAELSLEDQVRQTIVSTEFVVRSFGLQYRVFAFPYNDMSVSRSFFNSISGKVEASFGTQGLLKDSVNSNFQRISVEKFHKSAFQTVKFHYSRKIIYQLMQKDLIKRQ